MIIQRPQYIGVLASVIKSKTRWENRNTNKYSRKPAWIATGNALMGKECGICRIGDTRHIMTEAEIPGCEAVEVIKIVAVNQESGAVSVARIR